MKHLIWFGALLAACTGFAQAPAKSVALDMICVTETPSTSFVIKQEGEKIAVRVYHHNGSKLAPFWNSMITPNDLGVLTEQAQMVEKLGDDLRIVWNAEGCDAEDAMFFQCIGDAENFQANGIEVHPWALTVTQTEDKTLWGAYKKKNIALRMSVNEQSYQVNMDYYEGDCVKSGDPGARQKLQQIPLKQ